MPVFSAFFFWSFGTGGLWLARPLFAYEIGGTFFLVALISSASAMPRLVIGPVTGYLTDRFGRRPFVVLGALLHIAALTGEFFVQEYWQFLLFEVVAGTGIAVYMCERVNGGRDAYWHPGAGSGGATGLEPDWQLRRARSRGIGRRIIRIALCVPLHRIHEIHGDYSDSAFH